jgi:ParB/RepB/Spo0J family partition protein
METIQIDINNLRPNNYNPNEMTGDEFSELTKELQHLGRLPKPVVVRKDGEDCFIIVDGEHNWRAAKEVGLKELACEIIDVDDLEAMRQTYKRNQHGTHNPLKLGRMFASMMETGKLSLRALAEKVEVSEGTIRNALEYVKATEKWKDYPFVKLTVRQIRYYNRLPERVAKAWLMCGGNVLTLWKPFNCNTEEDIEYNRREQGLKESEHVRSICEGYGKYGDPIFWDALRFTGSSENHFIAAIRKIEKWCSLESVLYWSWGFRDIPLMRKYLKHYYKEEWPVRTEEMMKDALAKLVGTKAHNLHLTPEEFDAVINEYNELTAKGGGNHKDFMNLLQVVLNRKGIESEGSSWYQVEKELIEQEMDREGAPDYIRQSELRADTRKFLWKAEGPEWKKEQIAAGNYGKWISEDTIKSLLDKAARQDAEKAQKEEWERMSIKELATKIANTIPLYKEGQDSEAIGKFAENLARFTKPELLFLYEYTQYLVRWQNWKDMAAMIRGLSGA